MPNAQLNQPAVSYAQGPMNVKSDIQSSTNRDLNRTLTEHPEQKSFSSINLKALPPPETTGRRPRETTSASSGGIALIEEEIKPRKLKLANTESIFLY
jgi:hypothetical protein